MAESKSTQKIRLNLSSHAEKYGRQDAPVEDRRIAARGALPLEPIDLATVLFALLHDPDEQVKHHAGASLAALPEEICGSVLSGPAHPALLSHLCRIHENNSSLLEKAALNPAADDSTLAFLASCPHRSVIEIISQNQERLVACDEIVEELGRNPLTGRAAITRILEFLGPEATRWDDDILPADGEIDEEAAAAVLIAVLGQELGSLARPLARERGTALNDDALKGNLHAAIARMTVLQKIKLARYGGSDARALLVRDRNKVVASAVILSPKIRETEVLAIAKSRSVSDEILRLISNHREWTKAYGIKHALATNPKTPLIHAMRFLNLLQPRDLRSLVNSRNVPAAISAQARRLLYRGGERD
ncbi:MAG: hypothetical protein VCB42_10355 [Myxococcota bacterium]